MSQGGTYERTKNSLRNSIVAVSLQVASLLIGFWSRRIFLNHLGTEVGIKEVYNAIDLIFRTEADLRKISEQI